MEIKTTIIKTKHQEIRLEESDQETVLFLDNDLQFSSLENHLYDEAQTELAFKILWKNSPLEILILWGGDWLLANKILENWNVQKITLCELDEEIIKLCEKQNSIIKMNKNSFTNI